MQVAIRGFSGLECSILGLSIPSLPLAAVLVGLWASYYAWGKLTKKRLAALSVIAALFIFSWLTTDLYGSLRLYDLQANWHYWAYVLMTVFFFRAFAREGARKDALIYAAFVICLAVSLVDEGVQRFASSRVFDLNDNAKDALGIVWGIIVVYFVMERFGTIDLKSIPQGRQPLGVYVRNPAVALVLVTTFTLCFLVVSAMFSDPEFWYVVVLGTTALFAAAVAVLYLSRFKTGRRICVATALLLIAGQLVSIGVHRGKGITFHDSWLTVYNGVAFPMVDVLIFPNGIARPADKHHITKHELVSFFMRHEPSILLIGAEPASNLDMYLDSREGSYLVCDESVQRNVQVVVAPPKEACELFNRYKKEDKNVMCVLHATCGGMFM